MQKVLKLAANTPHEIRERYLLHLLNSMQHLNKQKDIWTQRRIYNTDTNLEHTYKVLYAAEVFSQNNPKYHFSLLKDKAIIHDITGDDKGIENLIIEKSIMQALTQDMLPPSLTKYAEQIWLDYKLQKTPEDKILNQLNMLDRAVLALDLEQQTPYNKLIVSDIYTEVEKELEHPTLKEIYKYLQKREFLGLGNYAQYLGLLKLNADIPKFRKYAKDALTPTKTQQILFNLKN